MKIADIHAHIFPEKLAEKASHSIGSFYGVSIEREADMPRLCAEDKLAGIHQIYFTKETIDAYGDELDAYFMNTNAKDCCWYPNGQKAYWSSQSLE